MFLRQNASTVEWVNSPLHLPICLHLR